MSHLYTSEKQLPLFAGVEASTPAETRKIGDGVSRDAMPRADQLCADQQAILQIIRNAGATGVTSAEISVMTGRAKNEFSGRITELAKLGLVFRRDGVRRDKCSVLFAKGFC